MEYVDKITLDDLNNEQREVAELLGLENYIKLVKNFGGTSIYVHKAKTIEKNLRDEAIRKEFMGDYKRLAIKYNLSVTQIREIVDKNYKKAEQISMF